MKGFSSMKPDFRAGSIKGIIILVLLLAIGINGLRVKHSLKNANSELTALSLVNSGLSLDQLEILAEKKTDSNLSACLSKYRLSESQNADLTRLFYSPYLICEAGIEPNYASSPIDAVAIENFFKVRPDFAQFCENLSNHMSIPELSSDHLPAASDTVVFSKSGVAFEEIHDEAIKWYVAGKYLIHKGLVKDARAIFLGILDLAVAFENNRLSHPDKARRMQTCYLIEIAAVGLIENADQLVENKADLFTILSKLQNQIDRMAKISDVMAFDKQIPLAFGQQIAKEESDGKTQIRYGRRLPLLSALFGDKKELKTYLDPLYNPLIVALANPYEKAQRAFNPFNAKYKQIFSNLDSESNLAIFKNLLFPDQFSRLALLGIFTDNLPFYVLLDVKARQLIEGAKAALIIHAFKKENGKWPASLKELETWFGKPLPQDLIRSQPLQFTAGNPPEVFSIGRDGKSKTVDDLYFVPFGQKAKE